VTRRTQEGTHAWPLTQSSSNKRSGPLFGDIAIVTVVVTVVVSVGVLGLLSGLSTIHGKRSTVIVACTAAANTCQLPSAHM